MSDHSSQVAADSISGSPGPDYASRGIANTTRTTNGSIATPSSGDTGRGHPTTAISSGSSGQTSSPSTCSRAASPARTYRAPAGVQVLCSAIGRDCGLSTPEPFANYDRESQSWKTSQLSLLTDSESYSPIWPRSGMTRLGLAFALVTSERLTNASEFSSLLPTPIRNDARRSTQGPPDGKRGQALRTALLPTPVVSDSRGPGGYSRQGGQGLKDAMALLPTPTVQASKHGATIDETANAHGYNLWDLPHLLPTPVANPSNPGSGGETRAALMHGPTRRNATGTDNRGRPNRGRAGEITVTPWNDGSGSLAPPLVQLTIEDA